jgi:replicative DNA helicase
MSTFEQRKSALENDNEPNERTFDIDAEQALLGQLFRDNAKLEEVRGFLKPEDFGEPLHVEIYRVILRFAEDGIVFDPLTLKPIFKSAEPIGNMPVREYLVRLFSSLAYLKPAKAYGKIIKDFSIRRNADELGRSLHQRAWDHTVSISQTMAGARQEIDRFVGDNRPDSYGSVSGATDSIMKAIRERRTRGGGISGVSTGYPKLDEYIDGLRPATLTIIGARPKQGKTAILLSIIRNVCKAGIACAFFSLELPKDEIVQRLIAMEANIDFSLLTRGRYDDHEAALIEDAAIEVNRWPLIIDDAGGLTPSALATRARTAVNVDGARVVFIDYLQRITPEKGSKRYEEVTAISMAIADLRKTLNAPIVCAAQLNRKLVDRSTKTDWSKFTAESTRPNDGDLRDSGQIEQDADALLFINRPEVQLKLIEPTELDEIPDWEAQCMKWRGRAEIIVHYNRSGRSGIVNFRFSGPVMRFDELM